MASNCKFVEPEFSLVKAETWGTLVKFWGVTILFGIVISGVIYLILNIMLAPANKDNAPSLLVASGICVIVVSVILHAYAINIFEKWDGCYKKQCA